MNNKVFCTEKSPTKRQKHCGFKTTKKKKENFNQLTILTIHRLMGYLRGFLCAFLMSFIIKNYFFFNVYIRKYVVLCFNSFSKLGLWMVGL